MAEKKTLEEAWEALELRQGDDWKGPRDLALAVLEELDLPCCGATGEDDPAWCGNPACLQAADMRRRIEELGR